MSRSLRLLNFFGLDFSFIKPFYRDSFCSELGTVIDLESYCNLFDLLCYHEKIKTHQ